MEDHMILGHPREGIIALLKAKSVKFGEFTLRSGKKSDFFIDCKQSILTGPGHVWAGQLMLETIALHFPEARAVAGVELGGCPLASAVSLMSAVAEGFHGLDALYVRKTKKDHGTGNLVEGKSDLKKGAKVILLEDVVTTGGSSLDAVKALQNEGFEVLGVVALVDRNEGAAEAFKAASVRFIRILDRCDLED
jgi:orotate phosphoribosyltransferase